MYTKLNWELLKDEHVECLSVISSKNHNPCINQLVMLEKTVEIKILQPIYHIQIAWKLLVLHL